MIVRRTWADTSDNVRVFTLTKADLRSFTVDRYKADWLDPLEREHAVAKIQRATLRDYESVVRSTHICPRLGRYRIRELTSTVCTGG